jgi:hypothetical protein
VHLKSRLNGVILTFVGVALLIVAVELNLSLTHLIPPGSLVAGVQLGGILIPPETATFLQNMFLIVGAALIILRAIVVVLGETGKRVKEMA